MTANGRPRFVMRKYIGPRVERLAQPIAGLGISPTFLATKARLE